MINVRKLDYQCAAKLVSSYVSLPKGLFYFNIDSKPDALPLFGVK